MSIETNPELLPAIEVDAPAATAAIIWLHGLGASNDDFVPIAAELQRLTNLALRFIFPQAPLRPVTINEGYVMPAWYDITSFDRNGDIDYAGIHTSTQQIELLIQRELERGLALDKIILAGFSQGAVIALSTLIKQAEKLGGVIALSGYLPINEEIQQNHSTPIFLGHGVADDVVPYVFGEAAYSILKKAQFPVTFRSYAMPHTVCDEEIHDIAEWLKGL